MVGYISCRPNVVRIFGVVRDRRQLWETLIVACAPEVAHLPVLAKYGRRERDMEADIAQKS